MQHMSSICCMCVLCDVLCGQRNEGDKARHRAEYSTLIRPVSLADAELALS